MNLTQTVRLYRLISKIFITAFLILISFRVSSDIARFVFPPAKVTPTPMIKIGAKFGKLPPLAIAGLDLDLSDQPSFRLDLVAATLPTDPKAVEVYPVIDSPYGFLSLDRVREVARKFFLTTEPTSLASHEYMFTAAHENLRVDDEHFNFTYNYDYQADPSFFAKDNFISRPAGLKTAKNIFTELGLMGGGGFFDGLQGKGLGQGEQTATFSIFENGRLSATEKISQATGLRVDFYRQELAKIPVVEPEFFRSQTYIFMGGKIDPRTKRPRILELGYTYWVLAEDLASTYPLISSGQAWEILQRNPDYIVALRPESASPFEGSGQLSVSLFSAKEVYLAYYNSPTPQAFLQPVWVFKGKANLTGGGLADWAAYVPAVDPAWIKAEGE